MRSSVIQQGIGTSAIVLAMGVGVAQAKPVTFDGITFPGGESSFADNAVNFDPTFSGSTPATSPGQIIPDRATGFPDKNSVSLSNGGRLTLEFTDNVLTGSGDSDADLHIFEIGPLTEPTDVEISPTGSTYTSVGQAAGGTSSIDIDAFNFDVNDEIHFVRLTDSSGSTSTGGSSPGADIDAVGAISSSDDFETLPDSTAVPSPAALPAGLMMLGGLLMRRRRG